MERTARKVKPASPNAPATGHQTKVQIEWWNRPITWAVAGLILLLAVVGMLSPMFSTASPVQQQPPLPSMTAPAPSVERTPTSPYANPMGEVRQNDGTVNVHDGSLKVDTNHGIINVGGTVNVNPLTRMDTTERVIERVIVERPVTRTVMVEKPVIVDHYPIYVPRKDTNNERCEQLAREHAERVANWTAHPFGE